jgi:hypothetical protein
MKKLVSILLIALLSIIGLACCKEEPFMVSRTINLIKQVELVYDTEFVQSQNVSYGRIYTGEKKERFYVEVKENWSNGKEYRQFSQLIAKDEESANLLFDIMVEQNGIMDDQIVLKTTVIQVEKQ